MKIGIIIFIIFIIFSMYLQKYKSNITPIKKKSAKLAVELLIKCCKKLKLKYNLLNNDRIHIIHNNKILKFKYPALSINKNICKKINCNKPSINKILLKNKIKTPQYEVFDKITSVSYINHIIKTKKTKYPLVVKPIDGSGGVKVFVNIKNNTHLKYILFKYFLNKDIKHSKTYKIMIEPYVIGQDYRVVCYNNTILAIVKRTPGYIIGDGIHTIKELTNLKNKTDKYHIQHPIIINKHYLYSINLNVNSVLKLNQKINPNYIGTLDYGGYLERVSLNKVHEDNIKMFKNINKILGFKISGIDILIKDINKSYKEQDCAINEVNSSPNILTTYYADNSYSIDTILKILKLYFEIN